MACWVWGMDSFLCQRAALDRGQHVIDFEAPMCFLYPHGE